MQVGTVIIIFLLEFSKTLAEKLFSIVYKKIDEKCFMYVKILVERRHLKACEEEHKSFG